MDSREFVLLLKHEAVDAEGREALVNPENSDMLHDLLSEVCAEDREL